MEVEEPDTTAPEGLQEQQQEGEGPSSSSAAEKRTAQQYLEEMGVTDLAQQSSLVDQVESKYREACEAAEKRAKRFGVEYKPPDKWALFKTEIKMAMRMRPQDRPFFTGIDVSSAEEQEKMKARGQRWNMSNPVVEQRLAEEQEERERAAKIDQRRQRFGVTLGFGYDVRIFPQIFTDLRIHPRQIYRTSSARKDIIFTSEYHPEPVPIKVHVFTQDSESFLKLRSRDVMGHFTSYCPQYVEWLGANSCNVLFADAFAAKRALEEFSVKLPSWDALKGEFPEKRHNQNRRGARPVASAYDISKFDWRLGKQRLVKKRTDEHGTAGTSVVVLMRVATVADVFEADPEKSKKKAEAMLGMKKKRDRGSGGGGGGDGGEEEPSAEAGSKMDVAGDGDKKKEEEEEEAMEEEDEEERDSKRRRRRGEKWDMDDDEDGVDDGDEEEDEEGGGAKMQEGEGKEEEQPGGEENGGGGAGDEEGAADDLEGEYADLLGDS